MKRRNLSYSGNWQRNDKFSVFMAHIALSANFENKWYFDSACSRHMTGNNHFLSHLKECESEVVTFGDGAQGKVLGNGTLTVKRNVKTQICNAS